MCLFQLQCWHPRVFFEIFHTILDRLSYLYFSFSIQTSPISINFFHWHRNYHSNAVLTSYVVTYVTLRPVETKVESKRGIPRVRTTQFGNPPLFMSCCAMDKPGNASPSPPDFSEPWKLSDVVLVVEEQRFHVHRSTLAFWSPVFERMFRSDFKEKNSDEIPLPGKKASEMKELLQMMYPSLDEKVNTSDNCYFLLDLAREG